MDWENRTVSLLLCLSILLATIHNGNAERKIVCYYTNWSIYRPGTAKFSPQNINPYLCTHLIYAFGGFTKDNALKPFDKYQDIEKGGYAKFTGLKTYNKNLKTLLAIGGWNEGSSRFSPMVADPGRRREFVKNAIKFLRKNHFDGLDLDWEYPAFRDGGKPRDKDNYANLVQELREEFEREASKTGRPRLLLTLAMPAGIEYIDKGYDIPRLNEYLDFVNLLSYDYHSSYEPAVNHHAPLYPLEEDNEYNYDTELTIDYTVNYLLKKGASSEKIILGIPTYGRSYTLFNQDATDLGSPADGPGIEGDATREKGYLAYYEICESLAQSDEWEVVEPNPDAMGPYAFKGDQWVGYDDEDIVRLKARYVNEKKLGGIMFWTIDNDDFRGKCHDRPYPLIEAAKESLLSDATDTVRKSKPVEGRKKSRIQGTRSDTERRKNGGRGGTTATPVSRNRVPTSSRPRYRTFTRPRANEQDEEGGGRVDRRSYDSSSEDEEKQGREEEEENSERGNAVNAANKRERSRDGKKSSRGAKNRSSKNRRKQVRRKEEGDNGLDSKESLSNKLTTPEPPTTPDPGTDFKCEDEGFFSHPRDCKKYFWCLDSGPGGLGVVAHQFTCPSGLVFNKAADSCDYPRNVACPKSKTSASTTRAPITAATSRTTYLYSTTTRRPSTAKPDPEEEYEYYEDEEEGGEEGEEEEEKEEAKVTSTPKTLLYKTITRNKPSTASTTSTTTTTTTTSTTTTTEATSKSTDSEDEEDPKVIKELITLIKKAGGIEQLEKQLLLQDKNSNESSASSGGESATPATISRTLYERVLNRQAGKVTSRQRASTNTNFANGPGRAQFEGLEEVPEVKGLRRSQKPKYVTIERPKHSTKEPPLNGEEVEKEEEEEDLDGDNTDVASSEEQTISNPFLTGSTQRATPNYIDIRRAQPSSTSRKDENDVEEKSKDGEEEAPIRRRRPSNTKTSSTENVRDEESRSSTSEENSQTTKSRYVSVQRFRSTTPQSTEAVSEVVASTTESIEPSKIGDEKVDNTTTSPLTSTLPWIGSSSTPNDDILPVETEAGRTEEAETERAILSTTSESSSTTDSVKLVEDSATEILLTTAPASLSTLSIPNTRISTASVSQPRPFGFNRRNRPSSTEPTTTTTSTTTPLPPSNDQTRSKVANTEVNRLPTLKELIGYQTNNYIATGPSPVFLNLFPLTTKSEEVLSREKNVDRVLEEVIIEKNTIFNDTELRSWNKHDDGIENDFQSNLTVDGIDAYYVEDDTLLANKKRIDREDSSEIDLKPTTMRGIPLINLLHSQVPRGFYVTKSEVDSTSKKVKIDALTTELTTLSVENNENIPSGISEKIGQSDVDGKVIIEHDNAEENLEFDVTTNLNTKLSMKNNRNGVRVEGRVESTSVSTDQVQIEKDVPSIIKFTEISIPEENVTTSSISISLSDSSPSTSQSSNESDIIINSTTKKSLTNDHDTPSILNIVIPITTISSNITTDTNLLESNVTELRMENTTHSADLENSYSINSQNRGKSTKNDEEFKSILSTTTLSSTSTVETSVTDRTINVFDIHDEKIKFTSNYEFGHKFRRRGQNRYYVNRLNKDQENSTKVVERRQNSRRKIIGYRRPLRRPVFNGKAVNDSFVHEVTTLKETKANDSKRNLNDWKDMNKEGTNVEKRLMSKANQTGNEAVFDEEHLRIKENIDRSESEVNSSKNTVTSRTPGNLSSTRLRKPTAFTLTPLQSKTTNTFANHRKTHLTDGKLQTVVNETLDTVDERTETSKPEKDIDQNSRAQEIAVTLADPPSVQSSTTGRPSLRNALKRKISTTVAPRTDATTSRASLRFTPALSDRQKPRTKDKTHRNSTTTRPRQRPPVVDYDYYEDEEEPVIGKSTFNGKLFLTSKGTFRCLDQGNFPHPYSCKKFITCARMVNGLVIGAEYTCPDRLSFDPVGGICNWSAGLGCKE